MLVLPKLGKSSCLLCEPNRQDMLRLSTTTSMPQACRKHRRRHTNTQTRATTAKCANKRKKAQAGMRAHENGAYCQAATIWCCCRARCSPCCCPHCSERRSWYSTQGLAARSHLAGPLEVKSRARFGTAVLRKKSHEKGNFLWKLNGLSRPLICLQSPSTVGANTHVQKHQDLTSSTTSKARGEQRLGERNCLKSFSLVSQGCRTPHDALLDLL